MATNREWLYSLDVVDLADWFDSEHVENELSLFEMQMQLEAMCDLANDYRFERDELKRQLDTMRDVTREFRDERDELQEQVDTLTRYIHDIKQIARKV